MRKWTMLCVALLAVAPLQAQIQRTYHYGVVPTENITTFEVNPSITAVDDSAGISSTQLTLKTYHVINERFNWGVEVPLVRYESPDKSVNGLGDILANITWTLPAENLFGFGAKMEFFLPTATDKRLGSGQLQASPSAFVLLAFLFPPVPNKQNVSVKSIPQLLKSPVIVGLYVFTFVAVTAHYTGYSYIEPFMAQIAHMPEGEITFSLTLFGVAGIIASVFFSRGFENHPKFFFATGTFGLAIFLALMQAAASHIWTSMLLCVFWGITFTIFGLVFQSVVIRLEPQATPIAMSIYSGIANVGIGSGALVGGWVFAWPALPYIGYVGAAFALVGGLICFSMIKDFLKH